MENKSFFRKLCTQCGSELMRMARKKECAKCRAKIYRKNHKAKYGQLIRSKKIEYNKKYYKKKALIKRNLKVEVEIKLSNLGSQGMREISELLIAFAGDRKHLVDIFDYQNDYNISYCDETEMFFIIDGSGKKFTVVDGKIQLWNENNWNWGKYCEYNEMLEEQGC